MIALACAVPVPERDEVEREKKEEILIVSSDQQTHEDGSYNFVYEGSDGSAREETAEVLNKDTDEEELVITGSYKYIDANGDEVLVNYTAGKNGFVPVGTIIHKDITANAEKAKDLPNRRHDDDEPEDGLNAPRN